MAAVDTSEGRAVDVTALLLGVASAALGAWAALANDVWFELHFTHTYCFVAEETATTLHVSRWIAGAVAIALLALARQSMRRRPRPTLRSFVMPALRISVAIAFAFVVADVILRFGRARRERAAAPPVHVFAHEPLEDVDVVAGSRRFHIALNKDKIRTRTTGDLPDPDAPTIVFSGESVAFGYGLEYDESIPALVAAHTGVQTINLGVNGFANDEALEWLKSSMTKINHPVAVVTFIVYNAIGRNIAPQRWHLAVRPGGGMELVKPREASFLERSPLFAVLRAAVPYHDDHVVGLTREIIRATAAYVRSRGAFPLFVLTETPNRCARQEPAVWRLVEGEGVSSIRVLYPESMQIPGDVHPDPRGAALFAEAIERALRDNIRPTPRP